MKTKYLLATIIMLISFTIEAQEPEKNKIKSFYEIEKELAEKSAKNLRGVFKKMFSTAKFDDKKGTDSCKPEDLVNKISIDGLMSDDENLTKRILSIKNVYLNYPSHLQGAISRKEAFSFDTRNYKSMEDGALSSFSNTDKFTDFVKIYTGGDVGDLNEYDVRTVRVQYDYLKENYDREFYIETDNFMSLSCSHKETSFMKLMKIDYPNATWQIHTVVTADCDCTLEVSQQIQKGSVEYTAETTGLLTTTAITFGKVENAKVTVKSLVCCPVIEEKEEESQIAVNDTDDDKGSFEVSAHVGLLLGDEKDFYSLNIGAEAAYLFNLSEHFSAGIGAGYTHFTPKEFTIGSSTFKGEGIGYAPIFGVVQYELSEKINVRATLGYALSTDSNIDGGLYCDVSLGWEAIPNYTIRPRIQFISLGEDRNFNSFGIGVSRSW